MSFFDDASLVMIPSGYKTSKVYSVKPTDGTGDLTFSRSNDTATRVGPDGLIEKVRTNLILQSEAFNTTWTPISSSVSANTTANPLDGAVNADTITLTGATTQKYIVQGLVQSGLYTYSVYAKAGTHNFIQLMLGADAAAYANFNISTGAVTFSAGVTASVVSAGSGWYRCSMSYSTTTATSLIVLAIDSGTDARFSTSASTGTFILFGAQFETGDIATDYIATTTAAVSVGPVANVPRLDYLNSSCPRLLLEGQRVNLFNFSEQLDNAYWSKIGSLTITANNAVSPDGYQNADLVTTTAASARIQRAFTGLTAGTRTLSCFVKAGTGTEVSINSYDGIVDKGAGYNLSTGVVSYVSGGVTATITNYGSGWYRLTHTYTSAGTSYSCQFYFDNVGTYQVYGFQFEDSASYATSYIPTLGAAVTRGADAASKTGISSLIGQTEGTIFLDFNLQTPVGNDYVIGQIYNSSTPANTIYFYVSTTNFFQALVDDTGGNQVNMFSPSALTQGNHKLALAYKANDFVFYIDGVQIATDTSGTVPTCNSVSLIDFVAAPIYLEKSAVNQYLLFPTRLSNADLAALTA